MLTSDEAGLLTICNPASAAAGWDLSTSKPEGWAVDMTRLAEAAAATGQTVLGPPLTAGDDMPAKYLGS